jgi:hypothetical protein
MVELLVHEHAEKCQPTTNTKSDHKGHEEVNEDIGLIGFSRFAIVFSPTILAFDMREHVRDQRAAPPGKTDFLGVTLSAVGAGSILSCGLHASSIQ